LGSKFTVVSLVSTDWLIRGFEFLQGTEIFFLLKIAQTDSGAHTASCSIGTGFFPRNKVTGEWCWQLTSIFCRD